MIKFTQFLAEAKAYNQITIELQEEQKRFENVTNWVIAEDEDGEEVLVEKFILENEDEEQIQADAEAGKKPSKANLTGVLHELLVGKHLNNGEHMEHHENVVGDSPKQAHDKYKALLDHHYPGEYKRTAERAESAGKDIRKRIEDQGHVIKKVHWTSKSGDIARSTGGMFNSTQKEDQSDIMVHSHHKDDPKKITKYTGISLKKTDTNSPTVPSSNLGIEHSGPEAKEDFARHQQEVRAAHPEIDNIQRKPNKNGKLGKIATARKDWQNEQPEETKKVIKERNIRLLQKTAKKLADHLNNLKKTDHEAFRNHIVTLLAARNAPMHNTEVNNGKGDKNESIRHITYGKDSAQHKTIDDVEDHYSHITNRSHHITAEASGGSVHFYRKDPNDPNDKEVKVAEQAIKFSSQSDPLSNIASSGREAKLTARRAKKDPNAPKTPRKSRKKVVEPAPAPAPKPTPAPPPAPINKPKPKRISKPRIFKGNTVTTRRLTAEQVRYILQLIRENRNA